MRVESIINRDFVVLIADRVSEMNKMIENFAEFYEIIDVVYHIREDHVEAGVIYNY